MVQKTTTASLWFRNILKRRPILSATPQKSLRKKAKRNTPEDVTEREKAACWQVQSDGGEKNSKGETVNGSSTKTTIWKNELRRHCEEVHVDPEETMEEQGKKASTCTKQKGTHILQEKGE